MVVVYAVLAVIGLAGTWFFNIRSMTAGEDYLAGWFGTAASSSAAADVLVAAVAACLFLLVEARRLGMRWAWVLVPLTLAVAVAFTFPLFLAWREVVLRRRAERSTPGAAHHLPA
ncbi:DUF2834 domain-containing protein [Aquipuribacter sp. SD81]|uniref:DUF2834 domain-containing protein n=1 Tax=Aquipuribacter sp. SD81 TaxID=3127703 RepID=UPI003015E397